MSEPVPVGQDPVIPVEFRVTTYWKRHRNEPGLTKMDSQRLVLSEALDWVLAELPDEAVAIYHDGTGSNVTIKISWDMVPGEIRYGKKS